MGLTLLTGVLGFSATAGASTARLSFASFTFEEAPGGEINRVSVAQQGLAVNVSDRVSIIGRGTCVRAGASTRLSCPFTAAEANRINYTLELGTGNDSASINAPGGSSVFDGPGNDVVRILGAGEGDMSNDAGNDTFRGGPGGDLVFDGLGHDLLFGNAGNDELTGGLGNDRIYGGAGNDDLRGRSHNDAIYGGLGDDYVSGSTGNDIMVGGPGVDQHIAWDGNDRLNTADAVAENVNCGRGIDTIRADRADRLVGCERVTRV